MKSLKEELIDFYVWCINNDIDHNIDVRIEKAVDKYLSINSEATFETPSVNDNEAQKKDCNSCEHRWMPITDCCRCDPLNGYMYWQQFD